MLKNKPVPEHTRGQCTILAYLRHATLIQDTCFV